MKINPKVLISRKEPGERRNSQDYRAVHGPCTLIIQPSDSAEGTSASITTLGLIRVLYSH